MNAAPSKTRRWGYKKKGDPKPVRIEYPDVALPIWISKAEYNRFKKDYAGADIWIDGKRVNANHQLTLL